LLYEFVSYQWVYVIGVARIVIIEDSDLNPGVGWPVLRESIKLNPSIAFPNVNRKSLWRKSLRGTKWLDPKQNLPDGLQ